MQSYYRLKQVLPVIATLFVVSCVSVPKDRGMVDVNQLLASRQPSLAQQPNALSLSESQVQQQVDALLAQTLSLENAVTVAFLKNPMLKQEYAKLGLVQADVMEAGRLSNPVLSLSASTSNVANERTAFDYGLVQNFTELLFLKTRRQAAQLDLQRAKADTGMALQHFAAQVANAYIQLVKAEQIMQMQRVAAQAAATSSHLAERFYKAGNISALELAREQASATQAYISVDNSLADLALARTRLRQLMGLDATQDQWTVENELPLPNESEPSMADLHVTALNNRLDLTSARLEAQAYARVLGLSQSLQWLPLLEVGVQGSKESSGARLIGPTVAIELPIFGKNRANQLRAQARLEQATQKAIALETEISSQIHTLYQQMMVARSLFGRYQNELLPQRQAILARNVEMHNYMLVGQFDLLIAKQQEIEANQGLINALGEYWLKRTELTQMVGADLPHSAQSHAPRLENIHSAKPVHSQSVQQAHAGHGMAPVQQPTPQKTAIPPQEDVQPNETDSSQVPDSSSPSVHKH